MVREVLPVPPPPSQQNKPFGWGVPHWSQTNNPSGLILPESKGLWFNNQTIHLDGWKFIACRFDNCTIYVSTGNFVIDSCFIDATNKVYFNGVSVNIIKLYNRHSDITREVMPGFAASKNSDGTLSIGV